MNGEIKSSINWEKKIKIVLSAMQKKIALRSWYVYERRANALKFNVLFMFEFSKIFLKTSWPITVFKTWKIWNLKILKISKTTPSSNALKKI